MSLFASTWDPSIFGSLAISTASVPAQVLISNGQQTLGVALPWGIAASLVRPREKVISISGDGGFLFSAMELEISGGLLAGSDKLACRRDGLVAVFRCHGNLE